MSQEKLHEEIIALSSAEEWYEAVQEWSLREIYKSENPQTCLCGHHPIREVCVIDNNETGNSAEVGNCCVNNFLGINSEIFFSSLRRVSNDNEASFNEATLEYAHGQNIINDWELKFYHSVWRKRKLSQKQREKKQQINEKILARLTK